MPLSPVSKIHVFLKLTLGVGCFKAFGAGGHTPTPLPETPVQTTTGTAVLGISKNLDGFEKPG